MRWTGRCEASGLGFDHGLEGIAAKRPLLLEIEANLCQLLRRQGFIEDQAPCFLTFSVAVAEASPGRVFVFCVAIKPGAYMDAPGAMFLSDISGVEPRQKVNLPG